MMQRHLLTRPHNGEWVSRDDPGSGRPEQVHVYRRVDDAYVRRVLSEPLGDRLVAGKDDVDAAGETCHAFRGAVRLGPDRIVDIEEPGALGEALEAVAPPDHLLLDPAGIVAVACQHRGD